MKKFLSALAYAWKNRETLGDSNYEREIAQFLPAALSVQHAPPHPLARWLTWALIALFSLAVLWACIGQIDIVASAEGKIIPSSRVKVIQPLEKSVVRRILVSEGQLVEQGQALVELDNTLTQATESQLQAELGALATNLAQTRLLFDLTALPVSQQAMFNAETMKQMLEQMANDLTPTEIQNASEMAWQQWQDYWSQYQALQNSLKKTQAEQMATQAQITKLEHTLPLVADRLQKVEQLYSRQYVAQAEYFELKQRHIEHIHNLQSEQQRLLQLQAQEAEIQESLRSLAAKAQAQRLANISEGQTKKATLEGELTITRELNSNKTLYSPVAGRVQNLAISTEGGIVTDAQQLMLIVPEQDQLQAEVYLNNKDIGFVQQGMQAEIKVHTFPFTQYGLVHAQVISVSKDAVVDEKQGLIYRMQLSLANDHLGTESNPIELKPGMAVTAELLTGKRRIIEFFLAPLLKAGSEGLRER